VLDTQSTAIVAIRNLTAIITKRQDDFELENVASASSLPTPCAVLGSTTSFITKKLATVSAAYNLLQVSPQASSVTLDDIEEFPLLARTHPSDQAMAQLAVDLLQTQYNVHHFGMLFSTTGNAASTFAELVLENAVERNMIVLSQSFNNEATLDLALRQLKKSQYNYFVGIFYPEDYEMVMAKAYDLGVAGPGRFWLFNGLLAPLFTDGNINRHIVLSTKSSAFLASTGNAILHEEAGATGVKQYDRFLTQWRKLQNDTEARDYIHSKLVSCISCCVSQSAHFILISLIRLFLSLLSSLLTQTYRLLDQLTILPWFRLMSSS
jgi:hypothetical protein